MIPSRVSIVIPFFNSEKFLLETIESVFNQTYSEWELLLVDDGSRDSSTQIAQQVANQNPERVRYLTHPDRQNKGISASRNLGFFHSEGEFIAPLDSDDIWTPQKLEKQVRTLSENPSADTLFGETLYWYSWMDEDKEYTRDYVWNPWRKFGISPGVVVKPPSLLLPLIENEVCPCINSLLLRRSLLEKIGGWEDAFRGMYEDQAFYVKLFLNFSVYVDQNCLEKYRIHEHSVCSIAESEGTNSAYRLYFLKWAKEYLTSHGYKDTRVNSYIDNAMMPYKQSDLIVSYVIPQPVGQINHGDLYRLTPFSRNWGFDRGRNGVGKPIDRQYIESFLNGHREDIKGDVLEIGERVYTKSFGGARVSSSDILDVDVANQEATIIGDLSTGEGVPLEKYDCFILTQTLLLIYDVHSAVRNAYRALKPGGVLLATLPGISQICQPEMMQFGDFWRFTSASVSRLFGDVFGKDNIHIETFGNVFTSAAFLYGLSVDDLDKRVFEYNDTDYQVTIAVRAVKNADLNPQPDPRESKLENLRAELSEIPSGDDRRYVDKLRLFLIAKSEWYNRIWAHIKSARIATGIRLIVSHVPREELKMVAGSALWDETWYKTNNPDVAQSGMNALKHYILHGGFEGRDPSSLFDSSRYLEMNPDVKEELYNPLVHYLRYGIKEGREIEPPHPSADE